MFYVISGVIINSKLIKNYKTQGGISMVVAKEIAQLSIEECMVIGFSVSYGFTNGSVGNVEWELEGNIENHLDISDEIKEGKLESIIENWQLSTKRYSSLDI